MELETLGVSRLNVVTSSRKVALSFILTFAKNIVGGVSVYEVFPWLLRPPFIPKPDGISLTDNPCQADIIVLPPASRRKVVMNCRTYRCRLGINLPRKIEKILGFRRGKAELRRYGIIRLEIDGVVSLYTARRVILEPYTLSEDEIRILDILSREFGEAELIDLSSAVDVVSWSMNINRTAARALLGKIADIGLISLSGRKIFIDYTMLRELGYGGRR